MTQRILVVDDDVDVVDYLRRHLQAAGFAISVAAEADEAHRILASEDVDLIVLDVMMPNEDGFQVLMELLAGPVTATVPVIVLTAASRIDDRIRALELGADDYVVKPFDMGELGARVQTVLRRAVQLKDLSPLTGLPGNTGITREMERRIAGGGSLALAHVDIGHFKSFNDVYGFLRGDAVIMFAARLLRAAVAEQAPDGFVGHIGGDDFVVLASDDRIVPVVEQVIAAWDAGIADFYDAPDAARGYVTIEDRRGEDQDFPLVTLSVGIATNRRNPFPSVWAASAIAAEMKEHAKRQQGSNYQVDRRH